MARSATTWSWTATVATTCSMADPATTVALPLAKISGIQVYGEDGADTIDAQTAVDLGGAREHIFGGYGNDTITAADEVLDEIDCGPGLHDAVVS
jgi:hypothetical protein